MRKLLLLSLSLLFWGTPKADNYIKLLQAGNQWNSLYERYTGVEGVGRYERETYSYTIGGDTIINTKVYKKIMCKQVLMNAGGLVEVNTNYAAAIREDDVNQKVYVKMPSADEAILYSFNVKAGDTVLIKDVMETPYYKTKTIRYVNEVENYTFGGWSGKKVFVTDSLYTEGFGVSTVTAPFTDVWFEGIGSEKALVEISQRHLGEMSLLCFSNYSTPIYHNSSHAECFYPSLPTGLPEIKLVEISVYPNPTAGNVRIDTDQNVIFVQVFSASGKQIIRTNEKTFDISEFPNGPYLIKVTTANGHNKDFKLLKQN